MLPTAFLARFITLRTAAATAIPATLPPHSTAIHVDSAAVRAAASEFALTWHTAQQPEVVKALLEGLPVIPKPLDSTLLTGVEEAVGHTLRGRDDLRKDARAAFWQAIKAMSAPVAPAG